MVEWQDIRGDCRDQDQRSEQVDNSYTQNATKVVYTGVRVVSPMKLVILKYLPMSGPDRKRLVPSMQKTSIGGSTNRV